MTFTRVRPVLVVTLVASMAVAVPAAEARAQGTPTPPSARQVPAGREGQIVAAPLIETDARETRQQFRELLGRYPPALARVFKLDPSLMANTPYLSSYPGVAAFLAQHPEIAHNPSYYLDFVSVTQGDIDYRQPSETAMIFRNMMEGFFVMLGMSIVAGSLIWLAKTIVDHRRWYRLSKVQTEAQTKVFDRMSSNEDLLAYIQTPAGRRFLEAGPLPLIEGPHSAPLSAPVSRILWSVQIGIVIAVGALGVLFVSGRVVPEVGQPLFAVSAVGISLGIGFVLSAVVSYVLSRGMGLLEAPSSPITRGGAGTNP